MRRLAIIMLLFAVVRADAAQTDAKDKEIISEKFRAFDYDAVIDLATQALLHAEDYPKQALFQIYEMKAVSHYSKMEMTEALNSFVEILKLDPEHELDPAKYSPKIVSFYNEIKLNMQQASAASVVAKEHGGEVQSDTVVVYKPLPINKGVYLSLVAPGAGHWLTIAKPKGMVLTGASTMLLASSIYFTVDCAKKEKNYLGALNQTEIDASYKKYNSSFRIRNTLWSAYALLWLYSQVDLFLLQKPPGRLQVGVKPPDAENRTVALVCNVSF